MDRINVFEGSRRIALALKVAWLLCVAFLSQLQSPFGGYALAFAAGGWLTLSVLQTYESTPGHTVLLLRTPATDLALHFQALNSMIGRLEQTQDLPVDSAAYQTSLDDLRGVLREMPRIASSVFWVRYGWWMTLLALICCANIND